MQHPITADAVEAYAHCPRKAFLLLQGGQEAVAHDYQRIIDEQEAANREAHRSRLASEAGGVPARGPEDLAAGRKVLLDAVLTAGGLEARCDAMRKVRAPSASGGFGYEPVKVVGTERVARAQAVGLAYLGHVLGLVQRQLPATGTLVLAGGRACRVKLAARYKEVRSIVAALHAWAGKPAPKPPPVVLNKHCPCCPFRAGCRRQAEEEDSLSLLDRMTPKLLRQYQAKGIFSVHQLSYLFRSRRSRKKGKRTVRHSLELQALAIRTEKTYVEHLPELARRPVELFVDMEGIPDKDAYYLAGLLVCRDGGAEYESFWADDAAGEYGMWTALADRLEAFPEAPIYHYGSYEKKAFRKLARRHGKGQDLPNRLVNVASSVYGKVYFPVRSNGLKSLGRFLGAAWSDPQASGLQSLVWRHRWETTRDERFRQSLLQYNREDCEAVQRLLDHLDQIKRAAVSDPAIEFANRPKRHATETGKVVHGQFERILRSAEEDSPGLGMRVRQGDAGKDYETKPERRRMTQAAISSHAK